MKKGIQSQGSLVFAHLAKIRRALLEGDKRPAFLAFLDETLPAKHGIYALYDRKGRLYYAGKASDLPNRLNQHLKDRHGESWDKMTLFQVKKSVNVAHLEGLLIAAARPPGNKQKPKIGQDLRRSLRKYLRRDANLQIDDAIYPERPVATDRLASRVTNKKLRALSQSRLAHVLGISQPRVSQLFRTNSIRQYIREAGKRDSVLLLLQKVGR
jgi:hypothetical protein